MRIKRLFGLSNQTWMCAEQNGVDICNIKIKMYKMKKNKPIIEDIRAIILMAILVIVPLFFNNYYFDIDEAKFTLYKYIIIISIIPYFLLSLVEIKSRYKGNAFKCMYEDLRNKKNRFYLALIIYSLSCILSFAIGRNYNWTFWGAPGWYMGLFSQLSFVYLVFMAAGLSRQRKLVTNSLVIGAAIVAISTVLMRMDIDPIGFYNNVGPEDQALFLSLIGQNSWLGQYLIIIIPFAIVGVVNKWKKKSFNVISVIFCILIFVASIFQNGDATYLSILASFLVIGFLSHNRSRMLYRWLLSVNFFFISAFIARILSKIISNKDITFDLIPRLFMRWDVSITGIILSLGLMALLKNIEKKGSYKSTVIKKIFIAITVVISVIIAIIIIILIISSGEHQLKISEKIPYLQWSYDWGNRRGWNWIYSVRMFAESNPITKLFGVGPDGYYCRALETYAEEIMDLNGGLYVFNSHNEYLNMLISGGIMGCVAYIWQFVAYCRTCIANKNTEEDYISYAALATVVSYMVYAFFTYQTVTGTPLLFVIMGLGLAKQNKK